MRFLRFRTVAMAALAVALVGVPLSVRLLGQTGPGTNVIVDNDDALAAFNAGVMVRSTITGGYRGSTYVAGSPVYAGSELTSVATFTFDNVSADTYRVYVTWPAVGSAKASIEMRIPAASGNGYLTYGNRTLNQSILPSNLTYDGVQWQYISQIVTDTAGTVSVRISPTDGSTGTTFADAVMLVRESTHSGTSSSVASSATSQGNAAAEYKIVQPTPNARCAYSSDRWQYSCSGSAAPEDTLWWQYSLRPGLYEVYAAWFNGYFVPLPDVAFTVNDSYGHTETTFTVNQTENSVNAPSCESSLCYNHERIGQFVMSGLSSYNPTGVTVALRGPVGSHPIGGTIVFKRIGDAPVVSSSSSLASSSAASSIGPVVDTLRFDDIVLDNADTSFVSDARGDFKLKADGGFRGSYRMADRSNLSQNFAAAVGWIANVPSQDYDVYTTAPVVASVACDVSMQFVTGTYPNYNRLYATDGSCVGPERASYSIDGTPWYAAGRLSLPTSATPTRLTVAISARAVSGTNPGFVPVDAVLLRPLVHGAAPSSSSVPAQSSSAPSNALQSVVVTPCGVTVNYAHAYTSCAHLIDASTSQPVHTQNNFCGQQGPMTVAAQYFTSAFHVGQQVKLCDGNNYNTCSNTVTVTQGACTSSSQPSSASPSSSSSSTAYEYFCNGHAQSTPCSSSSSTVSSVSTDPVDVAQLDDAETIMRAENGTIEQVQADTYRDGYAVLHPEWAPSTSGGPYLIFLTKTLEAGMYDVLAAWPTIPNLARDAQFSISTVDGTPSANTVTVNQTQSTAGSEILDSVPWKVVGKTYVASDSRVRIMVYAKSARSAFSPGVVALDGVMVRRSIDQSQPTTFFLDNADPTFAVIPPTLDSITDAAAFGGSHVVLRNASQATPAPVANNTITDGGRAFVPGTYDVYTTWRPQQGAYNNVRIQAYTENAQSTEYGFMVVDHSAPPMGIQIDGRTWQKIGTLPIRENTHQISASWSLGNKPGTTENIGVMSVDAIMIRPTDGTPVYVPPASSSSSSAPSITPITFDATTMFVVDDAATYQQQSTLASAYRGAYVTTVRSGISQMVAPQLQPGIYDIYMTLPAGVAKNTATHMSIVDQVPWQASINLFETTLNQTSLPVSGRIQTDGATWSRIGSMTVTQTTSTLVVSVNGGGPEVMWNQMPIVDGFLFRKVGEAPAQSSSAASSSSSVAPSITLTSVKLRCSGAAVMVDVTYSKSSPNCAMLQTSNGTALHTSEYLFCQQSGLVTRWSWDFPNFSQLNSGTSVKLCNGTTCSQNVTVTGTKNCWAV